MYRECFENLARRMESRGKSIRGADCRMDIDAAAFPKRSGTRTDNSAASAAAHRSSHN
jgi:hypothetical protein